VWMYCSSRRHTTSCNAALTHTRLARVRFRSCHFSRCYLYLVTSLRQLDAANMSRVTVKCFLSCFTLCVLSLSCFYDYGSYALHRSYLLRNHYSHISYPLCMHACGRVSLLTPLRHMCSNLIDSLLI